MYLATVSRRLCAARRLIVRSRRLDAPLNRRYWRSTYRVHRLSTNGQRTSSTDSRTRLRTLLLVAHFTLSTWTAEARQSVEQQSGAGGVGRRGAVVVADAQAAWEDVHRTQGRAHRRTRRHWENVIKLICTVLIDYAALIGVAFLWRCGRGCRARCRARSTRRYAC